MYIICESGSTKADWVLVENNNVLHTDTIGINPLFHDSDTIMKIIESSQLLNENKNAIKHVYFYGASCSNTERINKVSSVLKTIFTNSEHIDVKHDMDGAVYAVADPGKWSIVNILGTGSNSCLYDGQNIIDQRGGNGYIISDEAGGAYFGKLLCGDFLRNDLPTTMMHYFKDELKLNKDTLIQQIYKEPNANVYLASFASCLSLFKDELYVENLIRFGFNDFLLKHVCKFKSYKDIPTHFIGSIAYIFSSLLKDQCDIHHVILGNVIRKPIDGLLRYHNQKYNTTP